MTSLVLPPRLVAHVPTTHDKAKEYDLKEEPGPAALLLGLLPGSGTPTLAAARLVRVAVSAALGIVQVLGLDADDVVVVAQLARLGAEAEVRHGGDGGRLERLEAQFPLILGLVLELELEALVLEVREAGLGGDGLGADSTRRAAHELAILAVVGLVIRLRPVTDHGHNIGEHGPWAVVLVGIEKDSQALELVGVTKDRARGCALLGEPHCEAISM